MEIIIDEKYLDKKPRYYPEDITILSNPLSGKRVLPIKNLFINEYNVLIFQYYDENPKHKLKPNEHIVYEFNLDEISAIKVIQSEAEALRKLTNGMEYFLYLGSKIQVFDNSLYTEKASAPQDWY